MKKILVVSDDPSIVTLMTFHLEKAGYKTIIATDGKSALTKVEQEKPDLILLDAMFPELVGLEMVKQLRHERKNFPIVMFMTRDHEVQKMIDIHLGGDEVVIKPFSPRDVVAHVKALLRSNGDDDFIQVGEIRIDPKTYLVLVKEQQIEVTTKQYELLLYLVRNKGRVLTREQLLQHVWNFDYLGDSRIVDVHISHLREKIEENPKQPKYIKTIRGLGYKFEEPTI